MTRDAPRAVVVGGSIGGLTAALVLRDAGWDVEVHERSASPLEGRGAGIVLHPATVRYLVERGGASLDSLGVAARAVRYLDGAGDVADERPCSFRFTSYDTLYRELLGLLGRDRYRLGALCVGIDGAEVAFEHGGSAAGHLVVFADGVNSVGRRLLVPGAVLEPAGYVAWRGTVAIRRLGAPAAALLEDAIVYRVLPDGHVVTYPIPGGGERLVNWLWYRNVGGEAERDRLLTGSDGVRQETSVPPPLVPQAALRTLAADARRELPPPLCAAIERTAGAFVQAIGDLEVGRMAFGRACLIGDAAFTVRPHVAAGTAKAADDAWTLADAVGDGSGDPERALAAWSADRVALGSAAVARSRVAGERLQSGRWAVGEPLPFGLREQGDSALPLH